MSLLFTPANPCLAQADHTNHVTSNLPCYAPTFLSISQIPHLSCHALFQLGVACKTTTDLTCHASLYLIPHLPSVPDCITPALSHFALSHLFFPSFTPPACPDLTVPDLSQFDRSATTTYLTGSDLPIQIGAVPIGPNPACLNKPCRSGSGPTAPNQNESVRTCPTPITLIRAIVIHVISSLPNLVSARQSLSRHVGLYYTGSCLPCHLSPDLTCTQLTS